MMHSQTVPRVMASITLLVVILVKTGQCAMQDWLVADIQTPTNITLVDTKKLRLGNGIISRDFILSPDFATVDYFSYEKQSSLLRAVGPEAVISLDGIFYNVGGIKTNISRAYLNRTAFANDHSIDQTAFHFVSYQIAKPEAPYPYSPRRGAPKDIVWPPNGLRLDVKFEAPFRAPAYHKMISVTLHYEMYDGHPIMSKWLTVNALPEAQNKVKVSIHSIESLAVNWQWADTGYGWLYVQTAEAHGTSVAWGRDPAAAVSPGSFEQVVTCKYQITPSLVLDDTFESFHVLELVAATSDQERFGLAKRKLMRLLAPQTQENPIFFHMVKSDSKSVRFAIDQMAEVGFEMMIYSFGSGFNIESVNDSYIDRIAADIAYANKKGIEVGAYDLIALTRVPPNPDWLAKGASSKSACFASSWYDFLVERFTDFMGRTGMSMVETDGPYGGYTCNATNHTHHQGYGDSVYMQNKLQSDFYKMLIERKVYINQPDNYFYQGGSKTGMGYDENQYSLPRWQDLSISRQGMYDDTYHYIPSVGWMFVPLVDYHGGGKPAAFEPLTEHVTAYEWALAQYMGGGVAACYRGYRLYDSNETKALVQKWVSFYKQYRDILNSDLIHVRRADMQGIDSFMHVNPRLAIKALVMVFNPTSEDIHQNLTLPLYYTGLTNLIKVSQLGKNPIVMSMDRHYQVDVKIDLKPKGITWYIVQ